MLKLIRSFLKSGVMVGGLVSPSEEGTPQGGPLSPLLSNIVLDELDVELEKRGHKFARYADDCNIYVRSERAGKRVMDSMRRLITSRLRLRINESKSAVARPQQRKFLSFSFTNERNARRRIAPKALGRFKERIREITSRNRGRSFNHVVEELRKYLTGWRGYFGFCETPSVLKKLDGWIRRRLRAYLWKQWKTFDRRRTELQRRGVDHDKATRQAASRKGPWRSGHAKALDIALPIKYFDSVGLPRLLQQA
jgi:RNA-directed DNA polymerase